MKKFKEIPDHYSEAENLGKGPRQVFSTPAKGLDGHKDQIKLLKALDTVLAHAKRDKSGFGKIAHAKLATMSNHWRGMLGHDQALKQLKR